MLWCSKWKVFFSCAVTTTVLAFCVLLAAHMFSAPGSSQPFKNLVKREMAAEVDDASTPILLDNQTADQSADRQVSSPMTC